MINTENISKLLIKMDDYCDYVPFISTVSNLLDLFQKYAILPLLKNEIKENHYFKHINQKKFYRCVLLTIPILGNIAVIMGDIGGKPKPSASHKDEAIKHNPPAISEVEKPAATKSETIESATTKTELETTKPETTEQENSIEEEKPEQLKDALKKDKKIEDDTKALLSAIYKDKVKKTPAIQIDIDVPLTFGDIFDYTQNLTGVTTDIESFPIPPSIKPFVYSIATQFNEDSPSSAYKTAMLKVPSIELLPSEKLEKSEENGMKISIK